MLTTKLRTVWVALMACIFCLAIILSDLPAQQTAQPPAKRAPTGRAPSKLASPPKWDRAVLETFFSDARERLGAGPPPGQAVASGATETASPATPQPAPTAPSTGGGAHWSALVSATAIEDEVKSQVQSVAAAVQSPTGFKGGGYREAREEFSMLAVLFGVIGQYDGNIRFQKDAAILRSLFGRAGMNCKVGTDNSFEEAKHRSQDLAEVVRGGAVEQRPAEAEFKWPEVVNRPPLMKRMQKAKDKLNAWTSSGSEFGKNRAAIQHEAQLLAMICEVIKNEGYEYADDANYRRYVDELQQHCLDIVEATKSQDTKRGQSGAALLNKTCDACHSDFKS
ncbi:MAG TPA: hypothetical protein VGJ26_20350 [Pirellulales bacterium]